MSKYPIVLLIALILSGCGGSGESNDDSPSTLSGRAVSAQGNATGVSVVAFVGSQPGTASTVTDSEGRFSLTVGPDTTSLHFLWGDITLQTQRF